MRWAGIIASLVLIGCAARDPVAEEREADRLRRAGQLGAALSRARSAGLHVLEAEILLSQGRPAESLRVLEKRRQASNARWQVARAEACFRLGRKEEGLRALEAAGRLSPPPDVLARIHIQRGLYTESGERELRAALAIAGTLHDCYLEATVAGSLGYVLRSRSRFDEAIPWFEHEEKSARACGAGRLLTNSLGNLGSCYLSLGDFDRAFQLFSGAERVASAIGDRHHQQVWLRNIGVVHHRRGDVRGALSYLRRATRIAERLGDPTQLSIDLNDLGDVSLEAGDLDAAQAYIRRAIELKRQLRDDRSLVYSLANQARIDAARNLPQAESEFRSVIAKAREVGQPAVLWEMQGQLAGLCRNAGRAADADALYRDTIAIIDSEWAALTRGESRVTFLAQLIRFYQDYVDFLVEHGRTGEALEMAGSSQARVLAQSVLGDTPPPIRIADLQGLLRKSRTALLVYWTAPRRSFVWVITGQGVAQAVLPGSGEISAAVERYRRLLLARNDPEKREFPVAAQLYRMVLEPVRASIPPGASVAVVPDGPLHQLNFETLLVDGHYWIESASIAVAPSINLLRLSTDPSGKPGMLFIGDPVNDLTPLPHLKDEAAIVSRAFRSARLYTGKDATPDSYRAAGPAAFRWIHFAAHATANAESPLNSAIALTGGKLYAANVLETPISADAVILSACRGAGSRVYAGEGLLGLTWAFLHAGGHNVVAGLWDVDDEATSNLMRNFYEALARGMSLREALRGAKLQLLHSGTIYRKPYFWAPFEIFTRFL